MWVGLWSQDDSESNYWSRDAEPVHISGRFSASFEGL